MTLKGEKIYLRALEPEDLDFIHSIENDESIWELSHTQVPYSKYILKQYLKQSHKDIYEVKQLRLVISDYNDKPLGLIDIFDFDFKNKRAGIGIIIKEEKNKGKGIGKAALTLLIGYSIKTLQLHQLYCNISESNEASLKLFTGLGFQIVGLKNDWTYNGEKFENEYLLQLITTDVH